MIFTEIQKGTIFLKNTSEKFKMKHGYIICSHPLLFEFKHKKIFDEVGPGEVLNKDVMMRIGITEKIDIKFLIRYEVAPMDDNEPNTLPN